VPPEIREAVATPIGEDVEPRPSHAFETETETEVEVEVETETEVDETSGITRIDSRRSTADIPPPPSPAAVFRGDVRRADGPPSARNRPRRTEPLRAR
jgi:hypothetical protein